MTGPLPEQPLYKWLDGNQSMHGGTGRWQKGRWRSVRGPLVPCKNGLHLCRQQDLLDWVGRSLWVAEHDGGEWLDDGDKVVVRRARVVDQLVWDDRVARLFAADCAERVLPVFEARFPHDGRPRNAIETARRFANGEVTAAASDAARAAAGAAAWDAAGAVAGAVVWAAAGAVGWAAWDAAWAAAGAAGWAAGWDAARDAASDAARAAASEAERQWQTERLLDYAHGRLT